MFNRRESDGSNEETFTYSRIQLLPLNPNGYRTTGNIRLRLGAPSVSQMGPNTGGQPWSQASTQLQAQLGAATKQEQGCERGFTEWLPLPNMDGTRCEQVNKT